MLSVGDNVWGGFGVILAISNDYHTFTIKVLGGAPNGFTVQFEPAVTVAEITETLMSIPA